MNIRLAALTETLFQEEKQFLLGCYTNNFLDLLENQDEGIESEAIEVLLTVRPHVSPDLVERINTLLSINSTQNPELTNIEEASLSSTAAESTEQDAIENVFDKRSAEEEEHIVPCMRGGICKESGRHSTRGIFCRVFRICGKFGCVFGGLSVV